MMALLANASSSFHNRYSYTNGDPVNLTDPSGMIPERDKITNENFEYTYSCDCGRIDWKHDDPNTTAEVMINGRAKRCIRFAQ